MSLRITPPPPRDPLGGQPVLTSWMKWFNSLQQQADLTIDFTDLAFIVKVADTVLAPNAQALGSLATGYLKNTTATGVLTSQAVPIPVTDGGTGLLVGTSGGVLGFTGTTTLASSVLLTNHAIVLGRGAGATPAPLSSLGTSTTVLHGAAAGDPTFGAVTLTTDVTGVLPGANGGTGVANTSKTITLGGSVTFSGAFTFTGTVTGNTSVTFPTSGTLLTAAGAVTSAIGTANQVIVSGAVGDVTFTLPQSIATSSAPQFARLGLGNAADGTRLFSVNDAAAAPSTSIGVGIANYYGASATNFLGDPNAWLYVKIGSSTYKLPCYS